MDTAARASTASPINTGGWEAGDIIMSREDTLFSRVVQWATASKWSHCSLYCGEDKFVSAVPNLGVCVRDVSALHDYTVVRVPYQKDLRIDATFFALSKTGQKYDYLQIVLLAWRMLVGTMEDPHTDPREDEYVCSELVAESYASVGIYLVKVPDNALPGHLIQHPGIEVVGTSNPESPL